MSAKTMMTTAAAMMIAAALEAAVGVTNITARQRYPWNGKVDIDYEITGDDASAEYWVYPKGTDNRLGKRIIMNTLSGDGATNSVKVGKHRMVWDAKVDMPKFHTTDFTVTLHVVANAAQYLVIDVSGGANAINYPVRYSTEGPDLANDECRTSEIWMKLILPGTFMMGSASNGSQHQVTLTKPFYMAIFETTHKQWSNVMGGELSNTTGPTRPVDGKSYISIRGSQLGQKWPSSSEVDADSFMGKMRSKTLLHWDLPTEAQWEYSCRAGTTTDLNTGKNLSSTSTCTEMDEAGCYYGHRYFSWMDGYGGGTCPVGYKFPCNNFGLYNMHGNVSEWCLDWYNSYTPPSPVTDPVGWEYGDYRIHRGGGRGYDAVGCTSFCRHSASEYSNEAGFRAVVLPFD